ncbi:MAG: metallophosphoesterase family protein [Chloroflexi bacterium]|nr:metallophosphoesterase family protein [Chloroflexota bacterium]
MRCALIADIHANLTALKAVFEDLKLRGPIDQIWCTGDIVGYGPDPNPCVEFLRAFDLRCVLGNHDAAAVGMLDLENFNPAAKTAAAWTAGELTAASRQFLASLPTQLALGDYTLVHGSPLDPIWDYVTSPSQAKTCFSYLQTPHCLVGHTHVPALYIYFPENDLCTVSMTPAGHSLDVARLKGRILLNPGSVGQPRDRDPRAAYALLDLDAPSLTCYRVGYDIATAQQRMRERGLPLLLAERLSLGW